jgi:hypothetical protein
MRVSLVYDNQGNILAATVAGADADQFVLQPGEHAGEFDVGGESPQDGLSKLLENLRVETDSKKLIQQ